MTIPEQAVEKTLVEKRIGKYEHDLARHSAPSQPDGICKCPACIIDRGILAELKYMQMVERNSRAALPLVGVKWQPFETAPKDGRWIIARCNDHSDMFYISWGRSRKGDFCWCSQTSSYGDGLFCPNGDWIEAPQPLVAEEQTPGVK